MQGHRNENLECLTFPDSCFDLVITQDVFEHIANPENAFREIARVLDTGGCHVFTIPWFPDRPTRVRARVEGGELHHLLTPEYHGNPIDQSGSLVFTEFGEDLAGIVLECSGMDTSRLEMNDPECGIVGDSVIVLCSYKTGA